MQVVATQAGLLGWAGGGGGGDSLQQISEAKSDFWDMLYLKPGF